MPHYPVGTPFQPEFTYTPAYQYLQIAPPRFVVPNKRVAVEPFPDVPKAQVKGGVMVPMNGSSTTGLKVVFASGPYLEGQVVYVRSKLKDGSTYGKDVMEVGGKRFILLPEEEVLVVDTQPEQAVTIEPRQP